MSYDFTLQGTGLSDPGAVCEGSACRWGIQATYRNGTTEIFRGHMLTGIPDASTFTKRLTATNVSLSEITHIRADFWSKYYTSRPHVYSPWLEVATPSVASVSVGGQWTRNLTTGRVTYNLSVTGSGVGGVNGPCEGGACKWKLEALYRNGTDVLLGSFHEGSGPSGGWGFTNSASRADHAIGDVTHIRATLQSTYYTNRKVIGEWVYVADPTVGGVEVAVNRWERDDVTGKTSYSLTLRAHGAGAVKGPCEGGACEWRLEAWHREGSTDTLVGLLESGSGPAGGWAFTTPTLEKNDLALGNVTHIRAVLKSTYYADRVFEEWRAIGDFLLDDIDVAPLAGFLAASQVSHLDLCVTVDGQARLLGIPDTTPESPHPATEACLAASNVRTAVIAVAGVVGGAAVIGAIIEHYVGDDPNADSIRKVPAPETDTAGSGVRPPTSCLTDAEKTSILSRLSEQSHHVATDKNPFWTPLLEDQLKQDFPNESLKGPWNVTRIKHAGNHPPAYHYWIYRNLSKALSEADRDWATFEILWREWVVDVIRNDPTIVRWDWWRC